MFCQVGASLQSVKKCNVPQTSLGLEALLVGASTVRYPAQSERYMQQLNSLPICGEGHDSAV
eukprot:4432882-Amphidinium_carterae.1